MKASVFAFTLLLACLPTALADVRAKLIREAAEHLLGRVGTEVAGETVETLSSKIARYSAKYGDEAIDVIRKSGTQSFKLLDDAGENAPLVMKLLNRYGSDAVWVVTRPKNLAIFVKYGDEAAEAMLKHPRIATDVIDQFGRPAALAIRAASPKNARQIAMMASEGSLKATGHAEELLNVMANFGDKATQFIWKNKGALAIATVAAAFLKSPEPFIDGARDIAEIAAQPIDSAAREVGRGIATGTNWTLLFLVAMILTTAMFSLKTWWGWKHSKT